MPHNATAEPEAAAAACGWPAPHARDAGRLVGTNRAALPRSRIWRVFAAAGRFPVGYAFTVKVDQRPQKGLGVREGILAESQSPNNRKSTCALV
jgi:hypothetical protein